MIVKLIIEKRNKEIREKMKKYGIPQWLLAEKLGIGELTLGKWLRIELDPAKKEMVNNAIDELIEEYSE